MLHDHTKMRQGSRRATAGPGCRKPGLVRSTSVLAIQSNYPDVSLGILLEGPGCLTSPWSPGTFWYAVSRLTCPHLSEASSFHAIASCYVLQPIWHNKDDVVTGRRKQRVICWFSRAKHQAESLRSAAAEENITLPLCLNMCLIVAYFWYFSCVNSSNIYNAVDHVKRKEKGGTRHVLVLTHLCWTLSRIFNVCKKSKKRNKLHLFRAKKRISGCGSCLSPVLAPLKKCQLPVEPVCSRVVVVMFSTSMQ